MAAVIDFPATPTDGQSYTAAGKTWVYSGGTNNVWVRSTSVGASIGIIVSNTAPTFRANSLWWNSDTGLIYLGYNDGDSNQWVDIIGSITTPSANNLDVWQAKANKLYDLGLLNTSSQLVTLTANSTNVAIDWQSGINFTWSANANVALATPTNPIAGTWRTILVNQNVSPKLLTLSSNVTLKAPGGVFAGLTASANAIDHISIFCSNTTTFLVTVNQGYT
jgi:hypothetical protein